MNSNLFIMLAILATFVGTSVAAGSNAQGIKDRISRVLAQNRAADRELHRQLAARAHVVNQHSEQHPVRLPGGDAAGDVVVPVEQTSWIDYVVWAGEWIAAPFAVGMIAAKLVNSVR